MVCVFNDQMADVESNYLCFFVGFKNVSVFFFSMCTSKTEKINLTHISCKWVESANYTIRPWVQIWVSKKYDNNNTFGTMCVEQNPSFGDQSF